jgi:hypothetical protein
MEFAKVATAKKQAGMLTYLPKLDSLLSSLSNCLEFSKS